MAADFQIKKPADLGKINSNDMGELLWWTYQLGISPEKLLSIIQKFGNSTELVKQHTNDR